MFAVHLDTLLFLLLIGMAALLRLLASKAGAEKKKPPAPNETVRPTFTPLPKQPVQRAAPETDEERIRKFLEALGQPPTSKPPPPVIPRTDIPPRPVAPVRPPPGMFPIPSGTVLTPEERRKRRVILHEEAAPTPIAPRSVRRTTFTPAIPETQVFQFREAAPAPEPPQIGKPAAERTAAISLKIERPGGAVDIIALLQSPAGLRNAIILREIFGPPRSLQPLELVGI
jgi:hypothetical protein